MTTNVFTGDETGVMNAVEAAKATIIAKGYGEACISAAMANATGAIKTAVAVLEMNIPKMAVIINRIASTPRGPILLVIVRKPSAANSTPRFLQSDREGEHADNQDQCFPVDAFVGSFYRDAAE